MVQYLFAAYSLGGPDVPDDAPSGRARLAGDDPRDRQGGDGAPHHRPEPAHRAVGAAELRPRGVPARRRRSTRSASALRPASLDVDRRLRLRREPRRLGRPDEPRSARSRRARRRTPAATVNRVGGSTRELTASSATRPPRRRRLRRPTARPSRRRGTSGAAATAQGERGPARSPSLPDVFRARAADPAGDLARRARSTAVERDRRAGRGVRARRRDESHFLRLLDDLPRAEATRRRERSCGRSRANPTTDLDGPDVAAPGDPPPDPGATSPPPRSSAPGGPAVGAPVQRALPQAAREPRARIRARPRPRRRRPLGPRGALIHRTFSEMYNLRAIAGRLVVLPVDDADPDGDRAPARRSRSRTRSCCRRRGRALAPAPRPASTPPRHDRSSSCARWLRRGARLPAALAEPDAIERRQVDEPLVARRPVGGRAVIERAAHPAAAGDRAASARRRRRWTTTTPSSTRSARSATASCARRDAARRRRRPARSPRRSTPADARASPRAAACAPSRRSSRSGR